MSKSNNQIIGYVEALKDKDGYSIGTLLKIQEIDPKETIRLKWKLPDMIKKKENRLFTVLQEDELIKRKLRPTIASSIKAAYKHYLEANELEDSDDLEDAFTLTKVINILVGSPTVSLFVKSEYDGKEEPLVYTDNIMIYREASFNPILLREALKDNLPEAYKNIKEIQEFKNNKLDELFLKKQELDMIMSIKKKWKVIPAEKIKMIEKILCRIKAYNELESC